MNSIHEADSAKRILSACLGKMTSKKVLGILYPFAPATLRQDNAFDVFGKDTDRMDVKLSEYQQ